MRLLLKSQSFSDEDKRGVDRGRLLSILNRERNVVALSIFGTTNEFPPGKPEPQQCAFACYFGTNDVVEDSLPLLC